MMLMIKLIDVVVAEPFLSSVEPVLGAMSVQHDDEYLLQSLISPFFGSWYELPSM